MFFKNPSRSAPARLALAAGAMFALIFFIGGSRVEAASVVWTGAYGSSDTASTNKDVYSPGETITVTASATSDGIGVFEPEWQTGSGILGSPPTGIIFLSPYGLGPIHFISPTWGLSGPVSFVAPTTPGSYNIALEECNYYSILILSSGGIWSCAASTRSLPITVATPICSNGATNPIGVTTPIVTTVDTRSLTPSGSYLGTYDDYRGGGYNGRTTQQSLNSMCSLAGKAGPATGSVAGTDYACATAGNPESRHNGEWGYFNGPFRKGQGYCEQHGVAWVNCNDGVTTSPTCNIFPPAPVPGPTGCGADNGVSTNVAPSSSDGSPLCAAGYTASTPYLECYYESDEIYDTCGLSGHGAETITGWMWQCAPSSGAASACTAPYVDAPVSPVSPAVCGSSNGQSFSSAPTTNLCSSGTAGSVTTYPTCGSTTGCTAGPVASTYVCSSSVFNPGNWYNSGEDSCYDFSPSGAGADSDCFDTASSVTCTTNPSESQWRWSCSGSPSASCGAGLASPAPTATLTASPTSVVSGERSTLTWSSTDATSCDTFGPWSNSDTLSGSGLTDPLTEDTTFAFQCTGPGGDSILQFATVTVVPTASCSASTATWSVTTGGWGRSRTTKTCSGPYDTIESGSNATISSTNYNRGSVTLTCNNGTVTQSNKSCTTGAPCTLPWGGSILSGTSVKAYQSSTVESPATCVSETRACTNGTLSGSYTNRTCSVTTPAASCLETTIGTCSLSATASGNSAGSCVSGYTGSCNYSCTNGTWSLSSNSCSVPVAASVSSFTATPNRVRANPKGTTTLTWASSDADSCIIKRNNDTSWASGLNPNSSKTDSNITGKTVYSITCTGPGGTSPALSATVNITASFQEF